MSYQNYAIEFNVSDTVVKLVTPCIVWTSLASLISLGFCLRTQTATYDAFVVKRQIRFDTTGL
jgi:hypothetical protein